MLIWPMEEAVHNVLTHVQRIVTRRRIEAVIIAKLYLDEDDQSLSQDNRDMQGDGHQEDSADHRREIARAIGTFVRAERVTVYDL